MRPDRAAIGERLCPPLKDADVFTPSFLAKPERLGNDFFTEVAFADEEGNNQNVRSVNACQDFYNRGVLFPKRFADFEEQLPAAQLGTLLENGDSGVFVKRGSVAKNH
jgi:hypothetical protein